ncbi:hypothetical protein L0F51_00315 [Afifella sp. H1R]|nr:hypothetical protein [Afifella sp. H1R]
MLWAQGNANKRAPTTSELLNGHACGPADPDLEDYLKHQLQQTQNNFALQLTYAASQLGLGYDPAGEDQLYRILQSYADIIKQDMAISVPEDYPTIIDAMNYLSNYRIIEGVTVVISVASNTYNHGDAVIPGHPDGDKILVQGASLPLGMVSAGDFAVTGADASSRNADRITNDAMLRARFPTRIVTSGDAVAVGGNHIRLKNLVFIGDGDSDGLKASEGGSIECENVAVHYYANGMLTDDGGRIDAPYCSVSGCTENGATTSRNGVIVLDNGIASGCTGQGIQASFGGHINFIQGISKGNGSTGVLVSFAGSVQALSSEADANGAIGYSVSNGGIIQAKQSTATANPTIAYFVNGNGTINAIESTATGSATAYKAQESGYIEATSVGGTTTYSPTKNAVGNGNAYIKG